MGDSLSYLDNLLSIFIQLNTISADYYSFPPISSRGLTAVFNTDMDDSDDGCQIIHCISFVDPRFLQHLRCSSEHHTVACKVSSHSLVTVPSQLSFPDFTLSARNAWHCAPQSTDSTFPEARLKGKLLLINHQSSSSPN